LTKHNRHFNCHSLLLFWGIFGNRRHFSLSNNNFFGLLFSKIWMITKHHLFHDMWNSLSLSHPFSDMGGLNFKRPCVKVVRDHHSSLELWMDLESDNHNPWSPFSVNMFKVCKCHSVDFLDRTLIFDWCVFSEDQRTIIIKTHVQKRLGFVFKPS
jgi:hypothetical protein